MIKVKEGSYYELRSGSIRQALKVEYASTYQRVYWRGLGANHLSVDHTYSGTYRHGAGESLNDIIREVLVSDVPVLKHTLYIIWYKYNDKIYSCTTPSNESTFNRVVDRYKMKGRLLDTQ